MYIKSFKRLGISDVQIAGGKGAGLGELVKIGIPVPDGFVILTNAFNDFLKESGIDKKDQISLVLKPAALSGGFALRDASEKVRLLIQNKDISPILSNEIRTSFGLLGTDRVAVRSSSVDEDSFSSSWAGGLESFLNTGNDNLFENIKKCWSSLFSPRAMLYGFRNNKGAPRLSLAVVVQKMIQSEISGICFTSDPVTKRRDCFIIEAGYGLGEAIVGGLITPDTYVVNPKTGGFIKKRIGLQKMAVVGGKYQNIKKDIPLDIGKSQKLNDELIRELIGICSKVVKHYKTPQDIEWAYAKGNFFILQSRPITTP